VRLRDRLSERSVGESFQPKLWVTVVALALICAYLVAFVAKNDAEVEIHFVLFTAKTSVIWLILLSLAIGIVGGLLLSQLYRRRRGHEGSKTVHADGDLGG
jgi:uncharacterized integral membrane protein